MNNKTVVYQYNWGPPVTRFTINDDLIKKFLEKGNESREKKLDYRDSLAGNIEEEYYYEDYDWFKSDFAPYVNMYRKHLEEYCGIQCTDWLLDSLWINYQKAGEYNPQHLHPGHVSFIIYLDVPSEIAQEKNDYNHAGPGMVSFDYGEEGLLKVTNITHQPVTGEVFIFPAWLKHHVHSFKSPVERISMSGNITLKIGEQVNKTSIGV